MICRVSFKIYYNLVNSNGTGWYGNPQTPLIQPLCSIIYRIPYKYHIPTQILNYHITYPHTHTHVAATVRGPQVLIGADNCCCQLHLTGLHDRQSHVGPILTQHHWYHHLCWATHHRPTQVLKYHITCPHKSKDTIPNTQIVHCKI